MQNEKEADGKSLGTKTKKKGEKKEGRGEGR